jgi:hypothetical protein
VAMGLVFLFVRANEIDNQVITLLFFSFLPVGDYTRACVYIYMRAIDVVDDFRIRRGKNNA